MSQKKTTKNRKIESAVRLLQGAHASFTSLTATGEKLISALNQENLPRVKALSDQMEREVDAAQKLFYPAEKAMRGALHDRWPTEFRAPYKPQPQPAERVEIDKELPSGSREDHDDQKSDKPNQPVTSGGPSEDPKSVSDQPTATGGGSADDQESDPAFK